MRKIATAVLLAAGMMAAPAAHAQSWGVYVGNSPGYNGNGYGYGNGYQRGWDNGVNAVCSGQRAYRLEARLRQEYREGEIDGRDGARIQRSIDRLENKQRHECCEGDWGAIRNISYQYDQLDQWIDQEAHGRWHRGW
ncbi:MAG TPA: histidine kinase [Croceibacterium sp.]|jgi:hypothetical protein